MFKTCLVFWKSEPQYAYKLYAYKRKNTYAILKRAHEKWLFTTHKYVLGFHYPEAEISLKSENIPSAYYFLHALMRPK